MPGLTGLQEYLLDLSFALGQPLHHLRAMPVADLALYQRYTQARGFPGRRQELLLAQVPYVQALTQGAKNLSLSDFLMDPPTSPAAAAVDAGADADADADADQVAEFFGHKPRPRKDAASAPNAGA